MRNKVLAKLTAEQSQLITENLHLTEYVVYRNRRFAGGNQNTLEEMKAVAAEYLCLAASRFDPDKGDFDDYAISMMAWGIVRFARKEFLHGMSVSNDMSFKSLAESCEFDELREIPNHNEDNMDLVLDLIDIEKLLNYSEQCVFYLLYMGYKTPEIAEQLNIQYHTVSTKVSAIKKKLRSALIA